MTAPLNTTPVATNPELDNLQERRKMLVEKLEKHDKADGNAYARFGSDINDVKNRTKMQIAELDKEIASLTK